MTMLIEKKARAFRFFSNRRATRTSSGHRHDICGSRNKNGVQTTSNPSRGTREKMHSPISNVQQQHPRRRSKERKKRAHRHKKISILFRPADSRWRHDGRLIVPASVAAAAAKKETRKFLRCMVLDEDRPSERRNNNNGCHGQQQQQYSSRHVEWRPRCATRPAAAERLRISRRKKMLFFVAVRVGPYNDAADDLHIIT